MALRARSPSSRAVVAASPCFCIGNKKRRTVLWIDIKSIAA